MTYFTSDFERKTSPPGSITDITYNGYIYRESSNVESDTPPTTGNRDYHNRQNSLDSTVMPLKPHSINAIIPGKVAEIYKGDAMKISGPNAAIMAELRSPTVNDWKELSQMKGKQKVCAHSVNLPSRPCNDH